MAMLVSNEFTVAKQKLPLVGFDLMITEYNAHQSELTCHTLGNVFAALKTWIYIDLLCTSRQRLVMDMLTIYNICKRFRRDQTFEFSMIDKYINADQWHSKCFQHQWDFQ